MMKEFIFYSLAISLFCQIPAETVQASDNIPLPDLGSRAESSDDADQSETKNNPAENDIWASKTAQMATSEAQQNFQNLTPEGLKSQLFQYGKGMASGAAQAQAESLLSPYGHISTQFVLDDDGSLDGSSLDYLIPIIEGKDNLFFNQISAHNTDGRTIANLGAGIRHNLSQDWMIGANTFYDYDITRHHRRIGFGGEAWTNFLKLSGNYYLPLSSWKDSRDLENYEERPARGWDMRVQAYLPAYPQLGSSLVYEKYYGDEVALFGTDDLQKDPSAVTLGADYTPVPMVTLGVGYKKGNSDSDEVTAELALDYRIGVPISKQLDPSAVSQMRTLAGSRMDFVDRNNHIVLEYREKNDLDIGLYLKPTGTAAQCIIADTPEQAQAYEGCHWTVNASISSHLAIKEARWIPSGAFNPETQLGLPALSPDQNISAGTNNHWTLTFPAWVDSPDPDANKYTLSVMLLDDKGRSKQSNAVDIIVSEAPSSYQLVINDAGEEKKATKVLSDGKSVVDLEASGNKIAGLAGETTPINAEDLNMTFRAYKMEDKSHSSEVVIHASKEKCDAATSCLFYTRSPDNGKAAVSSTMSGVYTIVASPENKETQRTNAVLINFSPADTMFYTAIVDKAAPDINLTATRGNTLQLGHEYLFRVAYDSNNNGQWDASDRETISDTSSTPLSSLMNYRWQFTGVTPAGTPGGFAVSATDNHSLILPATNAMAKSVFAGAGAEGIQGYELKVDYQLTQEGLKSVESLRTR